MINKNTFWNIYIWFIFIYSMKSILPFIRYRRAVIDIFASHDSHWQSCAKLWANENHDVMKSFPLEQQNFLIAHEKRFYDVDLYLRISILHLWK